MLSPASVASRERRLRAVQLLLVNHVLAVDEVHVLLVHADDVDRARQRVDDAAVAVRQASPGQRNMKGKGP